jgi:hypothetical protein
LRTPLAKICRAFRELDRFSDAECLLLMRRVHLDAGSRELDPLSSETRDGRPGARRPGIRLSRP